MRAEVASEIGRTNRFIILEIWKDQAAFDAHGKSAATTAFGDKFKAIANAPPDIRVHNCSVGCRIRAAAAKGAVMWRAMSTCRRRARTR